MEKMRKQDMSDKINSLLGLDPPIDFARLKFRDLQRLYDAVSKIPNLIQVGARASVERMMQGPIVTATKEILNMPAAGLLREMREKGGFLGVLESRAKLRKKEPEIKVVEPDKTPKEPTKT